MAHNLSPPGGHCSKNWWSFNCKYSFPDVLPAQTSGFYETEDAVRATRPHVNCQDDAVEVLLAIHEDRNSLHLGMIILYPKNESWECIHKNVVILKSGMIIE